MPISSILRLRGSGIILSRESQKAKRRLDQLRDARRDDAPAALPETTPQIEKATDLIADTRTITPKSLTHPPRIEADTRCNGNVIDYTQSLGRYSKPSTKWHTQARIKVLANWIEALTKGRCRGSNEMIPDTKI